MFTFTNKVSDCDYKPCSAANKHLSTSPKYS